MKNSVFALAAAIIATTATVAAAQTPISEFRGPLANDYTTASGSISLDAPATIAGDEGRFNDFSGPVVRQ
ncbi:hypothetical protein [Rhizobium sp. EC-SD404]|uniref:hypothetical protein n=1 Tax=Rhizobium sp. EC-SD404 TaxID=2038389 RepID=UPI001253648B|nr:hypothetical protein [Rhizobium sp. EC-SD404]VVT06665.1 exported hypothetical protein [Rhizobium sp. EC-SD404]